MYKNVGRRLKLLAVDGYQFAVSNLERTLSGYMTCASGEQ